MIDGCHILDRQDRMIDHKVFTYNKIFSSSAILPIPLELVVLQDNFAYRISAVRLWLTITWTFMVRTLKILSNAHTNSIVRGQSTLRDVIQRYFWNDRDQERRHVGLT
jgi:hypothetical protein